MLRIVSSLMLILAMGISASARAEMTPEEEIRQTYEEFEKVINTKEFQTKDPLVAKDFFIMDKMRLFDLMEPEEFIGEDFKKHLVEISLAMPGKYEFGDLDIHVDGKVAYVVYIQRFTGVKPDGEVIDMRVRTTDGLEKTEDGWKLVHEHVSMPFTQEMFIQMQTPKE